jgi:hypothetical protein
MSERTTLTVTTISGLRIQGNRMRGYRVQREDRTPIGSIQNFAEESCSLRFVPVLHCTLSAVEVTELGAFMIAAERL